MKSIELLVFCAWKKEVGEFVTKVLCDISINSINTKARSSTETEEKGSHSGTG